MYVCLAFDDVQNILMRSVYVIIVTRVMACYSCQPLGSYSSARIFRSIFAPAVSPPALYYHLSFSLNSVSETFSVDVPHHLSETS